MAYNETIGGAGFRTGATKRSGLRLAKSIARSLEDPALQGRWFTYVEGINKPTEVLVEHVTVPWHKTQPTARYTAGTFRHYPGAMDVDGIQMVFYEVWDYRVTKWLNDWRRLVYDPETGIFGLPKKYRKEFVTEFYPPHNESPTMRRSYAGCFPIEQPPFEMTYAEVDGRVTVSALFAVNRVDTRFYAYTEDANGDKSMTQGLPSTYTD